MTELKSEEFLGEALFHFLGSGTDDGLLEVFDSMSCASLDWPSCAVSPRKAARAGFPLKTVKPCSTGSKPNTGP
jgi:hypothetical protein